jgi:hypothetical protein
MCSGFGIQKHYRIKNKNYIHFSLQCVIKDMKRNLHVFCTCILKFCFEFVCFPRFKKSTNEPRKTQNLAKKLQIVPKSSKINKINANFCDKSWQIFSLDPKYLGYEFYGYTNVLRKWGYFELKKKIDFFLITYILFTFLFNLLKYARK